MKELINQDSIAPVHPTELRKIVLGNAKMEMGEDRIAQMLQILDEIEAVRNRRLDKANIFVQSTNYPQLYSPVDLLTNGIKQRLEA